MEVRGKPSRKVLMQSSRRKFFFEDVTFEPMLIPNTQGEVRVPGTIGIRDILDDCPESFVTFIEKCLEWDPDKRIKPIEALMHPWIIEGLPPQVLLHHKRMIGLEPFEDDKKGSAVTTTTISPREKPKVQEQKPHISSKEMKQCLNSTQPVLVLPPSYHAKGPDADDTLEMPESVV
jgi:dual specificity tyrosine-phosphorylation-regulated kinase 2/3/4